MAITKSITLGEITLVLGAISAGVGYIATNSPANSAEAGLVVTVLAAIISFLSAENPNTPVAPAPT